MFAQTMSLSAKLASGLGLTIVGMGVVFTALTLISVALDLLRLISARLEGKKRPLTTKKDPCFDAPLKSPAAGDGELVAVITAAVAAASGKTSDELIVRSIRPRPRQDSTWSLAGRQQQMNDRLRIQNGKGFSG